jgi:hypothetical protein
MSDFHDPTHNRFMKHARKEKQTICAIIFQTIAGEWSDQYLRSVQALVKNLLATARMTCVSTYASENSFFTSQIWPLRETKREGSDFFERKRQEQTGLKEENAIPAASGFHFLVGSPFP